MTDTVVVDNGQTYVSEETAIVATQAAAQSKRWAEESERQANIATSNADTAVDAKDDAVAAKEYAEAAITDTNLITVATDLQDEDSNIKTVATNISNVNTVAGVSSAVTTVAGISGNVTAVASNSSNVTTVATSISNVNKVGNDISNVNDVADDLTNIDNVAGDLTNINTVAGISSEVSTVAGISSNVTTVAGISSNVSSVAGNASNINAVAGNATNINAVNANKTNIDNVAGNKTNIDTVAGISSDVSDVADMASDIAVVASLKDDIPVVVQAAADIDKVEDIAEDITTVSGISNNVTTVAGISSDVTAVAVNSTNITAVASDITNINAVAADLTNIDNASTYAAEAKQWAIGEPTEPSSGSAKYWAGQAAAGQVQADWTEADTNAKSYIKNKPDLSLKANTSLDNLNSTGKNIGNWSTNISNCITEIPQDIKLELNNGTLTLKSGSKVYYPDGTQYTTTSDAVGTNTNNGTYLVTSRGFALVIMKKELCFSGNTQPTFTGNVALWLDTSNSELKYTTNGGSTWLSGFYLPLCQVTVSDGAISSIDQVFNGFGYIGSTVFALPGVKGLIPNGRNEDGSLKNIEFTIPSVKIKTYTDSRTSTLVYRTSDGISAYNDTIYDKENNLVVNSSGSNQVACHIGKIVYSSGTITSLTPKTVFHAVEYNDFKEADDNNVKLTGNQTVAGTKTFSNIPVLPTPTEDTTNSVQADTVGARNTKLQGYANTSLSNLSSDGQMIIDSQNGTISNCILEISQRVNVSIENNVITVKAGSKVYIPNGTNAYDEVTISSDLTRTYAPNNNVQYVVLYRQNGNKLEGYFVDKFYSGSTQPTVTGAYAFWYDTVNNVIKYTTDTGATWTTNGDSFPIAVYKKENDVVSFAKDSNGNDMIFNGAGFIGHHAFIYPNVTGLEPNGYNLDGSLSSVKKSLTFLKIVELNNVENCLYLAGGGGGAGSAYLTNVDDINQALQSSWKRSYVKNLNEVVTYNNNAWVVYNICPLAYYTYNGTTVTDFTIRQPYEGARNLLTDDIEKEVDTKQDIANLVTSVSSASTDSQYPSAKLFYDTCGDIETLINAL